MQQFRVFSGIALLHMTIMMHEYIEEFHLEALWRGSVVEVACPSSQEQETPLPDASDLGRNGSGGRRDCDTPRAWAEPLVCCLWSFLF